MVVWLMPMIKRWKLKKKSICYSSLDQAKQERDFLMSHQSSCFESRVLVVVNSYSGGHRAKKTLKTHVRPIFQLCNVPFEIVVTEYAGHARDLGTNLDLSLVHAVLFIRFSFDQC